MKNIQSEMKAFMLERGWEKQLPADMAKSIIIEASELLEHFQWCNPTTKQLKKEPLKILDIEKELADIFIYTLAMSVLIDADVEKIIRDKLALAAKRYPAKLLGKSPYSSKTQDVYLKLKKAHRKVADKDGIMSTHWTNKEYKDCESAKNFNELLHIAFKILERMKKLGKPIVEVCGPMSTGGCGLPEKNFRLYNYAVKMLEGNGKIVFNPTPFQKTMERLGCHLKDGQYNMDILEVFYKGIFGSGYIEEVYFLPDWQSSKGASWERKTVADFGIKIKEYPAKLLKDFK